MILTSEQYDEPVSKNWGAIVKSFEIKGQEGKYLIYEDGRIYSIPRYKVRGGFVKPCLNSKGYPRIFFYTKNENGFRRTRKLVHLLVADVFLPPKPEGHEINHKDGNPRNPHYKNLEWLTRSKNIQHGFDKLGRFGPGRKLKREQILSIRKRRKNGEFLTNISKDFNVSPGAVDQIARRNTYKEIK